MNFDTWYSAEVFGDMDGRAGLQQLNSDKPTLHEILLADKLDFEAKLERAIKRKQWLKGNNNL